MEDSSWYHEGFSRLDCVDLIIDINVQQTVNNIEDLVFVVMFMPVKLSVNDSKPENAVIDFAE